MLPKIAVGIVWNNRHKAVKQAYQTSVYIFQLRKWLFANSVYFGYCPTERRDTFVLFCFFVSLTAVVLLVRLLRLSSCDTDSELYRNHVRACDHGLKQQCASVLICLNYVTKQPVLSCSCLYILRRKMTHVVFVAQLLEHLTTLNENFRQQPPPLPPITLRERKLFEFENNQSTGFASTKRNVKFQDVSVQLLQQ